MAEKEGWGLASAQYCCPLSPLNLVSLGEDEDNEEEIDDDGILQSGRRLCRYGLDCGGIECPEVCDFFLSLYFYVILNQQHCGLWRRNNLRRRRIINKIKSSGERGFYTLSRKNSFFW